MGTTIYLDGPPVPKSVPVVNDGRLRVAFLTPSLGRGGAERWIISLCRWLQPAINVVGVVCTGSGDIWEALRPETERWAPVTLIVPSRDAANNVLRSADVVIVWGFALLGNYLPADLAAKVVYVAHGSCEWTANHILGAEPWVNHWASVSYGCLASFPERLHDSLRVIHNGTDVERTTPIRGRAAQRRAWGVEPDQVAVTYLGRFSPEKRPEALADAIIRLPENYVAIMAGDGWRETETREYCQRVAGDRIKFVGFNAHVGDALAASDVWINVSPAEGFSLSLIEAWLAGVPCVSTPTGAIPELQATHGQLVNEVPIGADADQVAAAIVAARSESAAVVTERARRLAWSDFTGPAMAARWSDYIHQITRQR